MNVFSIIKRFPLSSLEIVAIWIVCMIPVPETPLDEVAFIDKWTHFVMYGSLTFIIWAEYMRNHNCFKQEKLVPVNWPHLLTGGMLCPILMGILVELAQAYLTTCRSGDWFDALCNSLGVLLGSAMGYGLYLAGKR